MNWQEIVKSSNSLKGKFTKHLAVKTPSLKVFLSNFWRNSIFEVFHQRGIASLSKCPNQLSSCNQENHFVSWWWQDGLLPIFIGKGTTVAYCTFTTIDHRSFTEMTLVNSGQYYGPIWTSLDRLTFLSTKVQEFAGNNGLLYLNLLL